MRRSLGAIAIILLLFCFITPSSTVFASSLSDKIIIQLTETHTEEQININVNLVTNTGVSGMTLELFYNKNVFQYDGYEQGPVLSDMDLISTDLSTDPSLPVRFNWMSQSLENNSSTGNILKLHFTLKPSSAEGEYEIGFRFNSGDITYIDNDNVKAKSAIISKAIINVAENKITDTEIVEESTEDENILLIVGAVVLATSIAVSVTLLVIKKKKEKTRKKNWLEI